jgi:hypothetical protein
VSPPQLTNGQRGNLRPIFGAKADYLAKLADGQGSVAKSPDRSRRPVEAVGAVALNVVDENLTVYLLHDYPVSAGSGTIIIHHKFGSLGHVLRLNLHLIRRKASAG